MDVDDKARDKYLGAQDAVGEDATEDSMKEDSREKQIEGGEEMDEGIDERKLVRKMDWYLIPVVMLLYLLSFLDRSVRAFLKFRWFYRQFLLFFKMV